MRSVASRRPGQRLPRLLLVFVLAFFFGSGAFGDSQQLPTTDSPVVLVSLGAGSVTIVTTARPSVAIQGDPAVEYRHVAASPAVDARIPQQAMLWSETIRTPSGFMTLPPESFVFPELAPGPHDAIIVHGSGNVTLEVPNSTALIVANVKRGAVQIDGYRNGVFVTHVGNGSVTLDGVGGSGAVQVSSGPIVARNSNFTRLRARTARGDVFFSNCSAQQIQVTSLVGSIVYDDGTFEPGLARFESDRGSVMLGIASGGVQLGAHSDAGKIYSAFGGDAQLNHSGTTDSQATIDGGGPLVTASSRTGSVIFYRGALRDHPNLLQHVPAAAHRFEEPAPEPRSSLQTPRELRARICVRPRCRV
jgi:hypothetical protein